MGLSVVVGSPNLQTCSLIIESLSADTISVKYATLDGNQPETYNNHVMIWESSVIPWSVPPITSELVPSNGQNGSFVMGGFVLNANEYIVGYAVGEDVSEIVTTALIAPGAQLVPATTVYISLSSISETALTVNYFTLYGYLPQYYGNWIGLWEGYASPYFAVKPLATAKVLSNSNQGQVTMNNLKLQPGQVYTLVYFMGPDSGKGWPRAITNAATILSFETEESAPKTTTTITMLPRIIHQQ